MPKTVKMGPRHIRFTLVFVKKQIFSFHHRTYLLAKNSGSSMMAGSTQRQQLSTRNNTININVCLVY